MHTIDPEVMRRLHSMSATAAAKFDGVEYEEFLSEAWLAYNAAKEKGQSDASAFIRAEYAIKTTMKDWISVEKGMMILDDATSFNCLVTMPSHTSKRTFRTRLPRSLKRALLTLTDSERRVIYLTYMWNRTLSEIAEDLNIAIGSVGRLRFTAIQKLKIHVGELAPPPAKEKKRANGKPPKSPYPQFLAPDGTIHSVEGSLKEFSDTHGICYKAARAMRLGTQQRHKGWSVLTSAA